MKIFAIIAIFIILIIGAFSCDMKYKGESASMQCDNGVQFFAYKGRLYSCTEYLSGVEK